MTSLDSFKEHCRQYEIDYNIEEFLLAKLQNGSTTIEEAKETAFQIQYGIYK